MCEKGFKEVVTYDEWFSLKISMAVGSIWYEYILTHSCTHTCIHTSMRAYGLHSVYMCSYADSKHSTEKKEKLFHDASSVLYSLNVLPRRKVNNHKQHKSSFRIILGHLSTTCLSCFEKNRLFWLDNLPYSMASKPSKPPRGQNRSGTKKDNRLARCKTPSSALSAHDLKHSRVLAALPVALVVSKPFSVTMPIRTIHPMYRRMYRRKR